MVAGAHLSAVAAPNARRPLGSPMSSFSQRESKRRRFEIHSRVHIARLDFLRYLCSVSLQSGCVDVEIPTNGGYISDCMRSKEQIFILKDGRNISIRQGWDGKPGHTGVSVWQSGKALAAYMESLGPNFWRDKSVIELGCGTGLGSIVAHYLGAKRVLATDGNSDVVELARENILKNTLNCSRMLTATRFHWGDQVPQDAEEGWDFVIGSDLTYNGQIWIQLADAASTLLESNPAARFLYCSAKHSQFSAELTGFRTVAEARGLVWDREFVFHIPGSDNTARIAWIQKSPM